MKNTNSSSVENVKKLLKEHQLILQAEINNFFKEKIAFTRSNFSEETANAVEVYAEITSRGAKRLRSALCYYTYMMYGGKDTKVAFKMGVVLELVHAYLLLLDDFMDQSESRRHGLTAHLIFSKLKKENNLGDSQKLHLGESIAVTAGAMGFHFAMQILNSIEISPEILIKLSNNLNSKIEYTSYGQIQDIYNASYTKVTEADVLKMLEWKTGIYTYENPIHSGALLAGVDNKTDFEMLSAFSLPAGIAFQIQDDILGMFGNPDDTGKAATDDLKEGKYTLLINYVLEHGTKSQIALIRRHLGNKNLTDADHEEVKEAMIKSGSYKYSKQKAHELVTQAKQVLINANNKKYNQEGLNFLLGIADYMIERDL